MSIFPSILNTFTRPNTTDRLNSPSHSALHNTVSSALGQVEATIGVEGTNSVVGTMMYDLRSPASSGGGHIQTANKGGTGQTAYTKGDILVAQSSSVLSKLAVSATDGYAIVTDSTTASGIKWGLPGNVPVIRVYGVSVLSSTITWSKPSILSYIRVTLLGGGGGGGGTSSSGSSGGGGGGGYAVKVIAASSITTTSVTVGVGKGGSGGASGANPGQAGGPTYFGNLFSVLGGSGGGSASSGGAGGIAGVGDFTLQGRDGGNPGGVGTVRYGGVGGSSPFGFGGASPICNSSSEAGNLGSIFGTGGSGAADNGGSNQAGGNGALGVAIIEEF